jgi:hypothetical protein
VDRSTKGTRALLEGMPPRARSKYGEMALRADRSFTAAIKLMCLSCCEWVAGEVRRCELPACPLYDMRARLFRVKGRKAKEVTPAA